MSHHANMPGHVQKQHGNHTMEFHRHWRRIGMTVIRIATHSSAFFNKFTTLLLSIHNSFTPTNIPTTSTQPFCYNWWWISLLLAWTDQDFSRYHNVSRSTKNCVPATEWLGLPAVNYFSALTLLVGWQEGHPACKNLSSGMVIHLDEVQIWVILWTAVPNYLVQVTSCFM